MGQPNESLLLGDSGWIESYVGKETSGCGKSDSRATAACDEPPRYRAGKNSVRCAIWPSDITRARSDSHQCCGGRGEETRLENERRRGRLWQQPCRLPTDGWRDACLNLDRRAQGPSGCDLPPRNQVLRERYPSQQSELPNDAGWSRCVARRYSTDRAREADRRDRMFGGHGFPG